MKRLLHRALLLYPQKMLQLRACESIVAYAVLNRSQKAPLTREALLLVTVYFRMPFFIAWTEVTPP